MVAMRQTVAGRGHADKAFQELACLLFCLRENPALWQFNIRTRVHVLLVRRVAFTMNKARKIIEQIEVLHQHLTAANEYVARNVNVRDPASSLHLGDWKGMSGHPLWMKNHMIPLTQKSQAGKVRALEKIATKAKEKRLKERRRKDAQA